MSCRLCCVSVKIAPDLAQAISQEAEFQRANRGPGVRAYDRAVDFEYEVLTRHRRWNPGAEFTMPKTRSHAVTRSRSPSSRLRLPSIERQVNLAASYASASDTSAPTTQRLCDRPVQVLRAVSGDVRAVAMDSHESERQDNSRQLLPRTRPASRPAALAPGDCCGADRQVGGQVDLRTARGADSVDVVGVVPPAAGIFRIEQVGRVG